MENDLPVQIVHALPHRVHLRAPRLAGHRGALERAAYALASSGGYARVTARPATGSFIVEDERPLDPRDIARRLEPPVRDARDDDGRLIADIVPEEHPGPTRVARAVAHAVAGINADVRAALDDRADLGTILPVFFAAAGITEVASTRKVPVPTWFNLLWWSLRSFMTFNIRAVEDEVRDGPETEPHDLSIL